jgi:hypothetical protein
MTVQTTEFGSPAVSSFPNLVACVKGYVANESQVLKGIVGSGDRSTPPEAPSGLRMIAENDLTQSLRTVLSTAEVVPQLQASQNFLVLQEELPFIRRLHPADRRVRCASPDLPISFEQRMQGMRDFVTPKLWRAHCVPHSPPGVSRSP